jgi:4-alpha-glucanotransferase
MSATRGFTFSRRACGLLLHPTSLPGHHGSGDLGAEAYRFADFCAAAGQTWWQMLPVNPPGDSPGNSPYSSTSAFAGSPYLISLEMLVEDGLLSESDLRPDVPLNGDAVAQFGIGFDFRRSRLRRAFEAFRNNNVLRRFSRANRAWLDDWSLFAALRKAHKGAPWTTWERDLRQRKSTALRDARETLREEIRFNTFVQFVFERQWRGLKRYCNARGVGLVGDIPIFVGHDSADVWARPELFLLDRDGNPRATSGYPPDNFNRLGQSWGHAQYKWSAHRAERFAWWVSRFGRALEMFDGVRIDHFLGFHRTWHVPAGARDGRRGKWVLSPGRELCDALDRALPAARRKVIAEDLGQLTREAAALRDRSGFPGMRVMQFGFGDRDASYHLPHNFPRNCVAYTGTHDNDTIVGWFDELRASCAPARKRRPRLREYRKAVQYLGNSDARHVNWDFIRAGLASCANTVIYPVQDVLGLDSRSRMNVPGTAEGNWRWRLRAGQLTAEHAARLRELAELYDRLIPRRVVRKDRKDHKEPGVERAVRMSGPKQITSL